MKVIVQKPFFCVRPFVNENQMRAARFTSTLLFLLFGVQAPGVDFPLDWKPLTPRQAMLLPGRAPTATLAAVPPSPVRRQPTPVSRFPLYGRLRLGQCPPLLFRLDEGQGNGKGYDRLILDFNRNADLTDDPEFNGAVSHAVESPYVETTLFGPVENAPEWNSGPWPAPLSFKVCLRQRSWQRRVHLPALIGQLEARSAWYLQTALALGPLREPLGLFDCNCNFKLGETSTLMRFGPLNRNISFQPRDLLLRDYGRNGTFDFNALYTDTQLFERLLCSGTNLFTLELDPDLKFVRLQPYAGPVGEVSLHEKLQSATLIWWKDGTWVPVSVRLEQGRARVPAGTWCLHSVVVRGVDTTGQQVLARGHNYATTNSFQVVQGRTTKVLSGPPFELPVETRRYGVGEPRRGTSDLCGLDINVRVVGAGGEIYSTYARGPDLTRRSDPPQFQILSDRGDPLLTGQLEYG